MRIAPLSLLASMKLAMYSLAYSRCSAQTPKNPSCVKYGVSNTDMKYLLNPDEVVHVQSIKADKHKI